MNPTCFVRAQPSSRDSCSFYPFGLNRTRGFGNPTKQRFAERMHWYFLRQEANVREKNVANNFVLNNRAGRW